MILIMVFLANGIYIGIICDLYYWLYRGIDSLYPQKKVVEFILKLNDTSKVLLKDPEDETEFELEIQSIWLDLAYVHLEVSAYKCL